MPQDRQTRQTSTPHQNLVRSFAQYMELEWGSVPEASWFHFRNEVQEVTHRYQEPGRFDELPSRSSRPAQTTPLTHRFQEPPGSFDQLPSLIKARSTRPAQTTSAVQELTHRFQEPPGQPKPQQMDLPRLPNTPSPTFDMPSPSMLPTPPVVDLSTLPTPPVVDLSTPPTPPVVHIPSPSEVYRDTYTALSDT